ncbi:MAG: hypothetical protein HUU46_18640 [Candidatus Hydrogenedentes bacterium]|nr:hypothetical protein [Candidatus Hydrogenedentota bacterium]
MTLNRDLKEFVELLNANGVDYTIVGAHALAFHGYSRFTGDIDILLQPSRENMERLISALREFGFGSLGYKPEDFLTAGEFVQLGVWPNRIDLLNEISGVTIDEIWKTRVKGNLSGIPVYFIARNEFLQNKRATGRGKDIVDIESLGEK